jgi:hypothetical protein
VSVFEDAALNYAAQDYHVLPLRPREKIPLTTHGLDDATRDALTIETWWARWPEANVGIRTGPIVVIDEDRAGALQELAATLGHELPRTRTARTGVGRHYYFTQPNGFRVRNTAGKLAPGIDTRGDGGYVVAPPSVHPSGAAYEWEDESDPAPLPHWIADLLRPEPPTRSTLSPPAVNFGTTPYGQKALEDETQAVATAPEGTRNDRLNTAAFNLGQLVAGGELTVFDARQALEDAAHACGLPAREAEQTIKSGLGAGILEPRTAPEEARRHLHAVPDGAKAPIASPAGPLRIVPLEEFTSVTEDSAAPLIGEIDDSLLTASGTLLMYGDGGAGKTTLSIDAMAHLAAGTTWLGNTIPRQLRLLLIENEGPRGPFRRRLHTKIERWDGDPFVANVHVLEEPWTRFTITESSYRHELAQQINTLQSDIIILGPLASLGAKGTGTPDEVNEFNELVNDLRYHAAYPFSLWIVHHENKQGDVSGAWERWPDTLVHVSAQGNGRTRVHWRKVRWSSRLHNTSINLLWGDNASFTIDEARVRDLHTELLEAFQNDDRWRTAREAAGLIGANQDNVRDALMALVETEQMSVQIGPEGRRPNAKCWRLKTDSEALSHHESLDLLSARSTEQTQVTRPMNESPESGQMHRAPQTDSDSPSQITSDDDIPF